MRRITPLPLALAGILALSACAAGGTESPSGSAKPSTSSPSASAPSDSKAALFPEVLTGFGQQPSVSWPLGKPPAGLHVKVLSEGTGPVVKAGDYILADYIGQVWGKPKAFNDTWTMGNPIGFSLNGVIKGWAQGIPGVKEGSRIALVIPPELGYPDGQPAAGIEKGETLFFVIDVRATLTPETMAGQADAKDTGKLAQLPVILTGNLGSPVSLKLKEGAKPPTELRGVVIAEGSGATLAKGGVIVVAYDVAPFDGSDNPSSWDRKAPETVVLGKGTAFDTLIGSKVGSRAILMLPSANGKQALIAVADIVGYAPPRTK